jgi:uncharacterized delta-60 repeat protein
MNTRLIFFFFIFFLLSLAGIHAQPGSLDKSFGENGIVSTVIGNQTADAESIAIQSDSKIVAAGFSYIGTNYYFTIARYDTNGSLDASFGVNGVITTTIDSGHSAINSLIIQPDGKLVVAGYFGYNFNDNFALARYNMDGSLDNSFGIDGFVTTSFGVFSVIFSSAIQVDGKIVVAGCMGSPVSPGGNKFALARYTTNGTLDSTFGTNGKLTTAIRGIDDAAQSVCIQADGKIIAAGGSYHYNNFNENPDIALVRYNTNGKLDTTFGTEGIVITDINDDSYATKINILENKKILISGYTNNGINYQFALAQYNTDGSLDKSFGTNGIVTTTIGSGDDYSKSAIIQPDNKIVLIGNSINNSIAKLALVRYNQDGSLDNLFGINGIVTTAIDSGDFYLSAVAMQHNGKIIVGGGIYINETTGSLTLARYISGLNIGDTENQNNSVLFYPNPSNNSLNIAFELKNTENVTISICNLVGQAEGLITDQNYPSGKHQLKYNVSTLSPGCYICTFKAGDLLTSKKLVVIR